MSGWHMAAALAGRYFFMKIVTDFLGMDIR